MAKEGSAKSLENALAQVNSGRRGFLRGMLVGGAALAALPLITSTAVAQDTGTDTGGTEGKKKKKKKGTDQTTELQPTKNNPAHQG